MNYPAKYPPVVNPANWNAMVNRINGFNPLGDFVSPYDWLVVPNGTNYDVCNAFQIAYSDADAATATQWAFNHLTDGRTWKEKVVLKGNFVISDTLLIPSYTTFEVFGKLSQANGMNKDMIENNDQTGGNSNIEIIIHGTLDGNRANQVGHHFGIHFKRVTESNIAVHGKILNTSRSAVMIEESDCNMVPILRAEGCESGIVLVTSNRNQLGLIYVKDVDYTGAEIYNNSSENTIDSVIGINCGTTPDPVEGGETFRIDKDCCRNIIGKVISVNSGYEGVRIEINSLDNEIGQVEILTTGNLLGVDGIEIYAGAHGTIIGQVNINGVRIGQGILIDNSDHCQIRSGIVDGNGVAVNCYGVCVYNSDYCLINVTSKRWTGSGIVVKGNSVGTIVNGHYLNNTSNGVEEADTADYTLLDNAVLLGNGTPHNVGAANSVVGDVIV